MIFELSTKSHVGIPGGERELVNTIRSRFSLILSSPDQQGLMGSRFQRISLKTFQLLLFQFRDIVWWKCFAPAGDKDGKREGEVAG